MGCACGVCMWDVMWGAAVGGYGCEVRALKAHLLSIGNDESAGSDSARAWTESIEKRVMRATCHLMPECSYTSDQMYGVKKSSGEASCCEEGQSRMKRAWRESA